MAQMTITVKAYEIMVKQQIKISVLNDDGDGFFFLQIQTASGITSTFHEFWYYKNEFGDFANQLVSFPRTIDDKIVFELGEIGMTEYFLLEVYCYERNGYSAIRVKVDNNGKAPYVLKSEFFILTVPASINKLGQLLKSWNPNIDKEIIWSAEE